MSAQTQVLVWRCDSATDAAAATQAIIRNGQTVLAITTDASPRPFKVFFCVEAPMTSAQISGLIKAALGDAMVLE